MAVQVKVCPDISSIFVIAGGNAELAFQLRLHQIGTPKLDDEERQVMYAMGRTLLTSW